VFNDAYSAFYFALAFVNYITKKLLKKDKRVLNNKLKQIKTLE
jgi:hypothetical protein